MDRDPDLLSTGQAAELLGCSRQHVVDLCRRGHLPSATVGTHRRVRRSDVDAIASGGTKSRRPEQTRSLWLHRAVAGRLARDPERVLHLARRNLGRLEQAHPNGMSARWLAHWRQLIDAGPEAVMRVLVAESDESDDLRQNSPFAGALPEGERLAILRAHRRSTLPPAAPPTVPPSVPARSDTMNRSQLEHVLRAAATIVDDADILVIGSQAILGAYPDDLLPLEATTSIEADLAFFVDPEGSKADRVDGAIGELSRFHETFGYYAQGVSVATAVLPVGWEDRTVGFVASDASPARARCLEPHDCVVAKLVAGRDKDRAFAAALIREGLVEPKVLIERIGELSGVDVRTVARLQAWVRKQAGLSSN